MSSYILKGLILLNLAQYNKGRVKTFKLTFSFFLRANANFLAPIYSLPLIRVKKSSKNKGLGIIVFLVK